MADTAPAVTTFLSYASEDRGVVQEMAKRLHADGIGVWLDEQKLVGGADWDLEIRNALERVDRALICLSYASVAKRGYIQREIRFAVKAAEEVPPGTSYLVPVRLEPVQIPEYLASYQAVDYFEEDGYQHLLRALSPDAGTAHDDAILAPPTPRPRPDLDDHREDFGDLIARLTRSFVGRERLFAALDEFVASNSCGYFAIVGDAGVGKSAVAAEVARREGASAYFFSARTGTTRPARCMNHLSAELIVRFGLPYGLPATAGPESAFFSRVLREASRAAPGPVWIVVDALDEADETGPAGANPALLPDHLPHGVFVLTTSRSADRIVATDPDTPLEVVRIATDTDDQRADIHAYIERRHAEEPRLRAALDSAFPGAGIDAIAARLVDASEGNFMYIAFVLRDLEEQTPDEPAMASEQLPIGLEGYYRGLWSRLTGAAERRSEWERVAQPVLEFLAVAREPVDAAWLAGLLGVEPRDVRHHALEPLAGVLTEVAGPPPGRWRIVHQTFSEYLARRDEIALDRARRAVGAYYADQPARWKDSGGYALRHLAQHLHDSGDVDGLFRLVESEAWWHAHGAADPSAQGFLEDVQLAWSAAEERSAVRRETGAALVYSSVRSLSFAVPARLLAELVARGIWTSGQALAAVSQVSDAGTAAEMLDALADRLDDPALEQALALAASIDSDGLRSRALTALGPRLGGAVRERAIATARTINAAGPRARALAALAGEDLAEEILTSVHDVAEPGERLPVLADVLSRLADPVRSSALPLMRQDEAAWRDAQLKGALTGDEEAYVDTVAKLADTLDGKDRADVLEHGLAFARAVSDTGEVEHDPAYDGPVRWRISLRELPGGSYSPTPHPGRRAIALATLAPKLSANARAPVVAEAAASARAIADPIARADAWIEVVTRLGDGDEARLNEAIEAVKAAGSWRKQWIALAPSLPIQDRAQTAADLATASFNAPDAVKGKLLYEAVSAFPELFRDTAVEQAASDGRTVGDQQQLALALGALGARVVEEERATLDDEAITALAEITAAGGNVEIDLVDLLGLLLEQGRDNMALRVADGMPLAGPGTIGRLPRNSAEMVLMVIELAGKVPETARDDLLLAGVAALDRTIGISNYVAAWRALAAAMPPELVPRALAAIEEFPFEPSRGLGYAALARAHHGGGDSNLAEEAMRICAEAAEVDASRAGILAALAHDAPDESRPRIHTAIRRLKSAHGVPGLIALADGRSDDERNALLSEALDLVGAPGEDSIAALYLVELIPVLPTPLLRRACELVPQLPNADARSKATAHCLIRGSPTGSAEQVLDDVEAALDARERSGAIVSDAAEALVLMASLLRGPALERALALATRIPDAGWDRPRAIQALAVAAADGLGPERRHPAFASTLRTLASGHRGWLLKSLVALEPLRAAIAGKGSASDLHAEILAVARRWP
jgi:hypothetical protein